MHLFSAVKYNKNLLIFIRFIFTNSNVKATKQVTLWLWLFLLTQTPKSIRIKKWEMSIHNSSYVNHL